MRYPILTLFLLSGCGLSPTSQDLKVIHGETTKAPDYFASLHFQDEKTPYCGGSFIAKNLVLTAAHCVSGVTKEIVVRQATSTLTHLPRALKVAAARIHPQYHTAQITYDIALLYLADEAEVRPIPITKDRGAKDLRVYGLGATHPKAEPSDFPSELQSAVLKEIPLYECRALAPPFQNLNSSQVCAADFSEGRDSCYGDSGGPLVTLGKEELYGLVSWGISCGQKNSPGIYTRVSAYQDWIDKEDFELSERVGFIFYYPLLVTEKARDLRFSGQHHLWRAVEDDGRIEPLASWTGEFQKQSYRLDILPDGLSRYEFRLHYDGKTYGSRASFTELNSRMSD